MGDGKQTEGIIVAHIFSGGKRKLVHVGNGSDIIRFDLGFIKGFL